MKTKNQKAQCFVPRRFFIFGISATAFLTATLAFGQEAEELAVLDDFVAVSTFEDALVLPSDYETPSIFGFGSSIVETPRNISLITNEQMEVFDIDKVEDFKQFSSGISVVGSFGDQQTPFIRGDLSDAYINGIRKFFQQSAGPGNFNGIESIEVVKGPAPANLGPSNYTGGFVNFTTKAPYFDKFRGSVKTAFGDYIPDGDSYFNNETTIDFGGPINENNAYRASVTYDTSDGYYDYTSSDSIAGYFSMTHLFSDSLRVNWFVDAYMVEWQPYSGINRPTQDLVDDLTYLTGDLNDGSLVFNGPGSGFTVVGTTGEVQLDRTANVGSPNDQAEAKNLTAQLSVTKELDSGWTLRSTNSFEYNEYEEFFEYEYVEYVPEDIILETKLELIGGWELFGLPTQSASGGTIRYQFNESYHNLYDEFWNIFDITDGPADFDDTGLFRSPQLGQVGGFLVNPGGGTFPANPATNEDTLTQFGIFHTQEIDLNEWLNVYGGARGDLAYADIENPVPVGPDPVLTFPPFNQPIGENKAENNDIFLWSLNGSVVVTPPETPFNVYFNYQKNQSYLGNIFTGGLNYDASGGLSDSMFEARSELFEFGVKVDLTDELFVGLSAYEQTRTRLNRAFQDDNLEVIGFEGDLTYQPSQNLWFVANYTYLDAELQDFTASGTILTPEGYAIGNVINDLGGTNPGNFPVGDYQHPGLPEHYFNAYLAYLFDNGIGTTLGFQYQGDYYLDINESVQIPEQFVFNASVYYETERWRFQLEGMNLTDEDVFNPNLPLASSGDLISVGLPTNFRFTATYKF